MNEREFLVWVLKENDDAVRFVEALARISQVWDDLIDGDEPDGDEINAAFWDALVTIPANPFFREHQGVLTPLIAQAVMDWDTANELESWADDAKNLAYVLRDNLGGVLHMCALLIGGREWATFVGPTIRVYVSEEETLDEYKERLA